MTKKITGDPFFIDLNGAKLTAYFWSKEGTTFLGPAFLPIFPLFWLSTDVENLSLMISIPDEEIQKIKIDFSKWVLKIEGVDYLPQFSIDQEGSTERLIDYRFPKMPFPNSLELMIDGVKVEGKMIKSRKIVLIKDVHWHYVPFILMHDEWSYVHHFPCK